MRSDWAKGHASLLLIKKNLQDLKKFVKNYISANGRSKLSQKTIRIVPELQIWLKDNCLDENTITSMPSVLIA